MRLYIKIISALVIWLGWAVTVNAQTVVDQLAAIVNGEAVTQSDIIWGLTLDPSVVEINDDPQTMGQMLNQLIDQRLLLAEAERLPRLEPTTDQIADALRDLIKRFPSEEIFYERVRRVGLTRDVARDIMKQRLQILNYIDFRFRSFAIITDSEIQEYFKDVLQPKLRARGIKPGEQPSDEERALIESILIEERVNREIERFLEQARQQADIVILAHF
ncbi:MAG: hypothetical protein AB1489_09530 [Acidobacteriota bacterium]